MAMSTETNHALAELMVAADRALYRAKAKGGNQVERTQAPVVIREDACPALSAGSSDAQSKHPPIPA
jgi:hypothetical protein